MAAVSLRVWAGILMRRSVVFPNIRLLSYLSENGVPATAIASPRLWPSHEMIEPPVFPWHLGGPSPAPGLVAGGPDLGGRPQAQFQSLKWACSVRQRVWPTG
jgi:hypothetical protein